MTVAIDYGYLPSGRYVFNHDIMNCTADGVVGNHLYSGRALGITKPWDIIQLHPMLKPLYKDIISHYKRVGLNHAQRVVWDVKREQLGMYIGHQPSVFYYGPNESRYWGDNSWLETVEFINSKNNFIALAEELGVDVPKTLCFKSVEEIEPATIQEIVFPCYLKAAISVSGVGIYRCQDEIEFTKALNKFEAQVPIQIQEEIKTDIFLNMQYRVADSEMNRLAASEQILKGYEHQGNRVPACHEPWEAIEPMAHWLKDRGMKGIFAFDVAVVKTNEGYRFPAIECNPRFNGASYPTLIARKLGIPEWSATMFETKYRSLAEIDLTDLEFSRKTGEGVIIVNWGTVLVGKLSILMAGSSAFQKTLEEQLSARLS